MFGDQGRMSQDAESSIDVGQGVNIRRHRSNTAALPARQAIWPAGPSSVLASMT